MKPAPIDEQQVLALLAEARQPMSIREMAEALAAKHDTRRLLKKLVEKLKRRKEIVEHPSNRYALSRTPPPATSSRTVPPAHPGSRVTSHESRVTTHQPPVTTHQSLMTGRLVAHRDGYGFVVPDKPLPNVAGDLFVSANNIGEAMHGDTVAVRIIRRREDGRAEATITRIVKKNSTPSPKPGRGSSSARTPPSSAFFAMDCAALPSRPLKPAFKVKS